MSGYLAGILFPEIQPQAQIQQKNEMFKRMIVTTPQLHPPSNQVTPNLTSVQSLAQHMQLKQADYRLSPSPGIPHQHTQYAHASAAEFKQTSNPGASGQWSPHLHAANNPRINTSLCVSQQLRQLPQPDPSELRQTPDVDVSQQWSQLRQKGAHRHQQNLNLDSSKQWPQQPQVPIDPRLTSSLDASRYWAHQQTQIGTPSSQSQDDRVPMAPYMLAASASGQSNGFMPGDSLYGSANPRCLNNSTISMPDSMPLPAVKAEKGKRGRKPKNNNGLNEQKNQPASQRSSRTPKASGASSLAGTKRKVSDEITKPSKRQKSKSHSPDTRSQTPQKPRLSQIPPSQPDPHYPIQPPPRTFEEFKIPDHVRGKLVETIKFLETTRSNASHQKERVLEDMQEQNIDHNLGEMHYQNLQTLAEWDEFCSELITQKKQELEKTGKEEQLHNLEQGVGRRQSGDKGEFSRSQSNGTQTPGQQTPTPIMESVHKAAVNRRRRSAEREEAETSRSDGQYDLRQGSLILRDPGVNMQHSGMQQQMALGIPYNSGIVKRSPPAMGRPVMQHSPTISNSNMKQHISMNTQASAYRQNFAMQHPYSYANMPTTIIQQGTYQNPVMHRPSSQSNGTSMSSMDAQQGQYMQHPSMQRPGPYINKDMKNISLMTQPGVHMQNSMIQSPPLHRRRDSQNMEQGVFMNTHAVRNERWSAANNIVNNDMHGWGQGSVNAGPQGMSFPNHGMHTFDQQAMNMPQMQMQEHMMLQNEQRVQTQHSPSDTQISANQVLNHPPNNGHAHNVSVEQGSRVFTRESLDAEKIARLRADIISKMARY